MAKCMSSNKSLYMDFGKGPYPYREIYNVCRVKIAVVESDLVDGIDRGGGVRALLLCWDLVM